MATVNSVLGPLDTADLGFTLMHEHIMVGAAGVYRDCPELLGPNRMERVVARLTAAKEEGIIWLRESAVQKLMSGATTLKEINKSTFVE